jgi:hypothetical protein
MAFRFERFRQLRQETPEIGLDFPFQIGGEEKIPDHMPIFLRTENCQWPNNILETRSISESIICVQRANLSVGCGAEDLS